MEQGSVSRKGLFLCFVVAYRSYYWGLPTTNDGDGLGLARLPIQDRSRKYNVMCGDGRNGSPIQRIMDSLRH